MDGAVLLLVLPMFFMSSCVAALLMWRLLKNTNDTRGWKKATATYYYSYPLCCPDSPSYDPKADTSECSSYSGCRWMGMFAGLEGRKSYEWVKSNNLAAVFQVGQTLESWAAKWKNKKIKIRNPRTGKVLDVLVVDTCGDSDCGGCCTENANKNGGTLIDLEWHTARRFYGSSVPGLTQIEWR